MGETPRHLNPEYFRPPYRDSELVLGLVGAVGTELKKVAAILEDRLQIFRYSAQVIKISRDVIAKTRVVPPHSKAASDEFGRVSSLMDAGNALRSRSGDNSILAYGVAAKISQGRSIEPNGFPQPVSKRAYIASSLKHPDEVTRLREIYSQGFYLIGVHADAKRRHAYLTREKRLSEAEAGALIRRDANEDVGHGQKTTDTFQMADFFVRLDGDDDSLKNSLYRILDLLFGAPYRTPTFDEYAMFMAFSSSLRSADLSRQVGAVVAKNRRIIATGANDCPRSGGGQYWPEYDVAEKDHIDKKDGRDYRRGTDSNQSEQKKIVDQIVARAEDASLDPGSLRAVLSGSRIADLTEYGRVVHAEMAALLDCARGRESAQDATLYCTTFPCHNCAKHLIAAGIRRVVFIEPYPKSKALEFHSDSVVMRGESMDSEEDRVVFEPFVGVGPRCFFDLFSMRGGSGYRIRRKDDEGNAVRWRAEEADLRIPMRPCSYLDLEEMATENFSRLMDEIRGEN